MKGLVILAVLSLFVGCSGKEVQPEYTTYEDPVDVESIWEDEEPSQEEFVDTVYDTSGFAEEEGYEEPSFPAADTPAISGWFATLEIDCNVRRKPYGEVMHALGRGRKLWVEVAENYPDWYTVYTRSTLAYMHKSCFGGDDL